MNKVKKTYDHRGRPATISAGGKFSQQLEYYRNGNVRSNTSVMSDMGSNWSTSYLYNYDPYNRLRQVMVGNDSIETYLYDVDGNIQQRWSPKKTIRYNYEQGFNRLTSIAVYQEEYDNTFKLEYDTRGNVVTHPRRQLDYMHYDYRNQIMSISGLGGEVSYQYDEAGNRVKKVTSNGTEVYLRDQNGRELAVYNSYPDGVADTVKSWNIYGLGLLGRANTYFSPRMVPSGDESGSMDVVIDREDKPVYYFTDHLGSVRMSYSSEGRTVFAENTNPYGEEILTYQSATGGEQKYDFTAKERDKESGLHYFSRGDPFGRGQILR